MSQNTHSGSLTASRQSGIHEADKQQTPAAHCQCNRTPNSVWNEHQIRIDYTRPTDARTHTRIRTRINTHSLIHTFQIPSVWQFTVLDQPVINPGNDKFQFLMTPSQLTVQACKQFMFTPFSIVSEIRTFLNIHHRKPEIPLSINICPIQKLRSLFWIFILIQRSIPRKLVNGYVKNKITEQAFECKDKVCVCVCVCACARWY